MQPRINRPAPLTPNRREEIVRRYWLKGELTPLGVANWLAGQPTARPA